MPTQFINPHKKGYLESKNHGVLGIWNKRESKNQHWFRLFQKLQRITGFWVFETRESKNHHRFRLFQKLQRLKLILWSFWIQLKLMFNPEIKPSESKMVLQSILVAHHAQGCCGRNLQSRIRLWILSCEIAEQINNTKSSYSNLLCIPQQYPCILWTHSSTLSLGFLLILLRSSDPPCLCGHPSLAAHTAPESTSLFAANLPSSPMWNHTQCCRSCHLMNVILAPPVSSLILTANFSIVDRMTTNFSNNCGFNIKVLELQIWGL